MKGVRKSREGGGNRERMGGNQERRGWEPRGEILGTRSEEGGNQVGGD